MELDLQGWDVVNAALFSSVNDAIVTQGKMPASFDEDDASIGKKLSGTWKTWEIVPGGTGGQLRLKMTMASGSASDGAVPTFARLDSNTVRGLTLDGTGLEASNPSPRPTAVGSAFGGPERSSGKFYFEVKNTAQNSVVRDIAFVGVTPTGTREDRFPDGKDAYGLRTDGSIMTGGNAGTAVTASNWDAEGSVVGVAVDLDNGLIWFTTPNGAWRTDGADPASGTGEDATLAPNVAYVPAVCLRSNAKVTVNFGATAFEYMPPVGFVSGWTGAASASTDVDLKDASATALITLAKVPGPGGAKQLMAGAEQGATLPAAEVDSFTDAGGDDLQPEFGTVLQSWLDANLTTFKNIFHMVDASGQAAGAKNTGYEWLTPKDFSYAVADEPGGTKGVFSVMSLIKDLQAGVAGPQQDIPPSITSYMDGQQNAVMVLSAEQVVAQILWRAAPSLVKKGATGADFDISADGRSVTNNKALDWKEIKLEDKSTITPKIPVGGLTLKVEGRKIKVSYEKLTFKHPLVVLGGNEVVDFSFDEELYLKLHDGPDDDDGNPTQVLYPTFADPQDATAEDAPQILNLVVTTQLDDDARRPQRTAMIVGIVLSAVSVALVAFSVGSYIIRNARIAQIAAVPGNELQLKNLPKPVNPQDPIYVAPPRVAVDNVYSNAPVAAQMDGEGIPFLSKLAIGAGVMAGIAALGAGTSWTLYGLTQTAITKEDFTEVSSELSVQAFLEKALAKFVWPSTTEWKLDAIELDGSLIFKGKLS